MQKQRSTPTGLWIRHSRKCATQENSDAKCNCEPSVQAWAWDRRAGAIDPKTGKPAGQKVRKAFTGPRAQSEAKAWRAEATGAVRRGQMRAPTRVTLREAADEWLKLAQDGQIRRRGGDVFKPSTLHGYSQTLNQRVLPKIGAARLSDITRTDLQDLADRMLADGLDPSTIKNALMPLRAIFGRAVKRNELAINPTVGLDLPAVKGRRDRIVEPAEAAELLESLAETDRALWATAIYAGLRRGELLALRWSDVDLANGVIRVERSYDPRSGQTVTPKSHAGKRTVPILATLRDYLDEAKLRTGENPDRLVFGRPDGRPFNHSSVVRRATTAWKAAEIAKARDAGATDDEIEALEAAPFDALTLHEGRHSYGSLLRAAGVDPTDIKDSMGHASVSFTLDRYTKPHAGAEAKAALQVDEYITRVDTAGRLSQLDK